MQWRRFASTSVTRSRARRNSEWNDGQASPGNSPTAGPGSGVHRDGTGDFHDCKCE